MHNRYFSGVLEDLGRMPAFSEHEHHQADGFFEDISLDKAVCNSYAGWCGRQPDGTRASRADFLEHVGFNSYWHWFEEGLRRVYGLDAPVTLDNWDGVSARMKDAHADADFHWRMLLDAGYACMIQDSYWSVGARFEHPEIFTAAYRIDSYLYGYHESAKMPADEQTAWQRQGFDGGSLDDFLDFLERDIQRAVNSGHCCALKCAEAYNRPIAFHPDDRAAALRAFGRAPGELDESEKLLFGNYVFNRCCEIAARLGIPFQVHTGLGDLKGSDPMNLVPTLERHQDTRFVLFHSGYPWCNTVAGIAHNYRNACPSMAWTPIISTSAAVAALEDFIDAAPSINTITWGSDCWTGEESVGALAAWRHVIARVVSRRLDDGLLSVPRAQTLMEKLMFANGLYVYPKADTGALAAIKANR